MNDTNREPEADELMDKLRAWSEASKAIAEAKGTVAREPRGSKA